MKRAICIFTVIFLILGMSGCAEQTESKATTEKIVGVWFSYSELDAMLLSGDFKAEFTKALNNSKNLNITDFFIHIRPFCDSLYPSEYFPLRQSASNVNFDVLEFIVKACHERNIRVHGWINPYRVRTADSDINALSENNPVRQWLLDQNTENDSNVCLLDGIYLNPASHAATRLITDGIREVIEKYEIDGIHFDDYFYPTESAEFDKISYEAYSVNIKNPLSLEEWRRANINAFISSVSSTVKAMNKEIIFSISPAASVQKNYQSYYADVKLWVENGYIDWIMPQLYFGFNYPDESFRFEHLFKEWQGLSKNQNVKLIIGLAAYKIDTENETESEEWSSGNVLSRQIKHATQADGFCFFSYTSLFSENKNNVNERQNIENLCLQLGITVENKSV